MDQRFELYGEAYRIFKELEKGPEGLSSEEIQDKWNRIADIEQQIGQELAEV
jgi:hypothetical protein